MSSSFSDSGTIARLQDLSVPTQALFETSYRDAVADRLRQLAGSLGPSNRWRGRVEACSSRLSKLVKNVNVHPLVAAIRLAYTDHRPLCLSPDTIWLALVQGVAQHVRLHAGTLRHRFVSHLGQMELAIQVNAARFHWGSPENPWPEAVDLFSERIHDHVGEVQSWFLPDFTTTGPVEKAASQIVLMDAMEKYFTYKLGRVICGIPYVVLEGTADDWRALGERAARFREFDLDWWLDPLQEVLARFQDAAAGQVDEAFWKSVYRVYQPDEPCSPKSALGWFILLFPYLSGAKGISGDARNPWLAGDRPLAEMLDPARTIQRLKGRRESFLLESALPTGLSRVPFVWQDLLDNGATLRTRTMEFIAGFLGVSQDQRTRRLRPEIGWSVCDLSAGNRP
jgi:hypothetical protein